MREYGNVQASVSKLSSIAMVKNTVDDWQERLEIMEQFQFNCIENRELKIENLGSRH